jgi:hypothetical protein
LCARSTEKANTESLEFYERQEVKVNMTPAIGTTRSKGSGISEDELITSGKINLRCALEAIP